MLSRTGILSLCLGSHVNLPTLPSPRGASTPPTLLSANPPAVVSSSRLAWRNAPEFEGTTSRFFSAESEPTDDRLGVKRHGEFTLAIETQVYVSRLENQASGLRENLPAFGFSWVQGRLRGVGMASARRRLKFSAWKGCSSRELLTSATLRKGNGLS